jgi:hypothetical protein
MTAGARTQSGRNPNWPLMALIVAHATIVVIGLTLAAALQRRLPAGAATVVTTWAVCQVVLAALIAGYAVRTSRRGREHLDQVAERILASSLMAAGAVLSMMLAVVIDNLDQRGAAGSGLSPRGLIVIFSGVYLSSILGRRLGSAASARRFRLGRPARRVSWMATVGADRTWRVRFGLVYAAVLIPILLWFTASQGFPPFLAIWLAAIWWVSVGMGPAAAVFITETGVRVVGRSLEDAPGWAVPVADIASVGVVDAAPVLQPVLRWDARRCVLRSGPALEVTTSDARRYLVSLPAAADAAAVLHGLMASSGASSIALRS